MEWSQLTHPLLLPVSPSRTQNICWLASSSKYTLHRPLCVLLKLLPRPGELPFLSLALFIVPPLKPTPLKLIILFPILPLKSVYNLFQYLQNTASHPLLCPILGQLIFHSLQLNQLPITHKVGMNNNCIDFKESHWMSLFGLNSSIEGGFIPTFKPAQELPLTERYPVPGTAQNCVLTLPRALWGGHRQLHFTQMLSPKVSQPISAGAGIGNQRLPCAPSPLPLREFLPHWTCLNFHSTTFVKKLDCII